MVILHRMQCARTYTAYYITCWASWLSCTRPGMKKFGAVNNLPVVMRLSIICAWNSVTGAFVMCDLAYSQGLHATV